MNDNKVKIILFVISTIFLSGCSITKDLKPDEKILNKNNLFINNNIVKNKDSLNSLFLQKTNSKFLGIPFTTLIHNSAKKNTDSIFEIWIKNKRNNYEKLFSKKQVLQLKKYYKEFNEWKRGNGEELAIIDSIKISETIKNLNIYFKNIGFLDNNVKFNLLFRNNKKNYADVNYNVSTGPQYYIGDVSTLIESETLDSIYKKNVKNSFLKKNEFFNVKSFELERNRLNKLFKNSGIYNFQINSILFDIKVDSTNNNFSLPVKTIISGNDYNIHRIDKITINNVKDNNKLNFNENFLISQIDFKVKSIFNDSLRTTSIQNFNKLDLFNFPSINYDYLDFKEKKLEASILLNPKKKYSIGFGFDIKQSSIEDIGISFENQFKIRNVFRNGENLKLSATGSVGKSSDIIISQINYDISLKFPKFIFLGSEINNSKKLLDPRSLITFRASNQKNIGLDRNSLKFDFNFSWNKKNNYYNYSISQIELIKNKNAENYFNVYSNSYQVLNQIAKSYNLNDTYFSNGNLSIPTGIDLFINDVISENIPNFSSDDFRRVSYLSNRKKRLTTNNLIIGSSFLISNNFDNRYDKTNFKQWKIKFQSAGILTNLIINRPKNSDGLKTISDLPFSQFFKSELSYIKHWNLGENASLASRYFLGFAIPFGNSKNIPFSESFFAGGSNDNRAWEVYRLGPGSSGAFDEFNEGNFKIALNFEYRFKMIGRFNGAIFTDIGNIWNLLDDTEEEKRKFNGFSDLNELAIGSGLGIRYDSGLFVFRFDIGLKTYNPALNKNKRWLTDFNLKKAVFNIGLNYPF